MGAASSTRSIPEITVLLWAKHRNTLMVISLLYLYFCVLFLFLGFEAQPKIIGLPNFSWPGLSWVPWEATLSVET